MRSTYNPSRRIRNIGTAKQGHGKANSLVIPWRSDGEYYRLPHWMNEKPSGESLIAMSSLLILAACTPVNKGSLIVEGELFEVENTALAVTLKSDGDSLYCVPHDQFSDYYGDVRVMLRNGVEAKKKSYANKPIQMIRGVDLAGGVYVVGAKNKTVYPSLDNYDLAFSKIDRIEMQLRYFDCDELTQATIKLKRLNLTFRYRGLPS